MLHCSKISEHCKGRVESCGQDPMSRVLYYVGEIRYRFFSCFWPRVVSQFEIHPQLCEAPKPLASRPRSFLVILLLGVAHPLGDPLWLEGMVSSGRGAAGIAFPSNSASPFFCQSALAGFLAVSMRLCHCPLVWRFRHSVPLFVFFL